MYMSAEQMSSVKSANMQNGCVLYDTIRYTIRYIICTEKLTGKLPV